MEFSGYRPSCWRPLALILPPRQCPLHPTRLMNASSWDDKWHPWAHITCFLFGMDVGRIGRSVGFVRRHRQRPLYNPGSFQGRVRRIKYPAGGLCHTWVIQKCCSIFFPQSTVRRVQISAGRLRILTTRLPYEYLTMVISYLDLI